MSAQRGPRLVAGMGLLVGLWIAVYWSWEPTTNRVTLHRQSPSAANDAELRGLSDAMLPVAEVPAVDDSSVVELVQGRPPAGETPADAANEQASEAVAFEYIVKRGDSFESIAREFLGDSALWTVLARENPFVSPERLSPGAVIRVPTTRDAKIEPAMPVAVPRDAEYVVASGDTLSAISQRVYGTTAHTDALFRANRDRLASPNALKVGQVLVIPPIESFAASGDQ